MSTQCGLSIRHIFGANGNAGQNGAFLDEFNIVYIGGHAIIIYNRQDKRQRFVHVPEIKENITAFALGNQRRCLSDLI